MGKHRTSDSWRKIAISPTMSVCRAAYLELFLPTHGKRCKYRPSFDPFLKKTFPGPFGAMENPQSFSNSACAANRSESQWKAALSPSIRTEDLSSGNGFTVNLTLRAASHTWSGVFFTWLLPLASAAHNNCRIAKPNAFACDGWILLPPTLLALGALDYWRKIAISPTMSQEDGL
jgi:hypothetical protein